MGVIVNDMASINIDAKLIRNDPRAKVSLEFQLARLRHSYGGGVHGDTHTSRPAAVAMKTILINRGRPPPRPYKKTTT